MALDIAIGEPIKKGGVTKINEVSERIAEMFDDCPCGQAMYIPQEQIPNVDSLRRYLARRYKDTTITASVHKNVNYYDRKCVQITKGEKSETE